MEKEYDENRMLQLIKAEKNEAILYVCETTDKDKEYSIFWYDVRYWALVENRYNLRKGYEDNVSNVFTTVMPVTLVDNEYMDVGDCESQKVCLIDWDDEHDIIKQSPKTDPNWQEAREKALMIKYKKDIELVINTMREQRQRRKEKRMEQNKTQGGKTNE